MVRFIATKRARAIVVLLVGVSFLAGFAWVVAAPTASRMANPTYRLKLVD